MGVVESQGRSHWDSGARERIVKTHWRGDDQVPRQQRTVSVVDERLLRRRKQHRRHHRRQRRQSREITRRSLRIRVVSGRFARPTKKASVDVVFLRRQVHAQTMRRMLTRRSRCGCNVIYERIPADEIGADCVVGGGIGDVGVLVPNSGGSDDGIEAAKNAVFFVVIRQIGFVRVLRVAPNVGA